MSTSTRNKKIIIVTLACLTAVGLIIAVLEVTNVISLRSSRTSDSTPKTTSKEPTAQEDFSDGGDRQPAESNRNEGTVSDGQGSTGQIPNQSQWTVSPDKKITIYSPTADSVLKSGSQLTGASSLQTVSFRLIDDVTGVIAQGSLQVVDGKYSGTFNFTTTAATGRLDLFNVSSDGTETSNVELPIRFK